MIFESLKSQLDPGKYQKYRKEIDFELNVYRRFPNIGEYLLDIKNKEVKVKNKCGSWVAWAIGITDEKPEYIASLKVNNPTSPDIDLDFTHRDKIVDYLFDFYGNDHVSMIGSFQMTKTKAALKDIVRAKNNGTLPSSDPIHRVCKTIEDAPQYYPNELKFLTGFEDDDGQWHKGHIEDNPMLKQYLFDNQSVTEMLGRILGKPRYWSKHAGGVVIVNDNRKIDEVIPTRYYKGKKTTQVDYRMVEEIGGMKLDILGVNTLNYIWDTVHRIEESLKDSSLNNNDIEIDPWNLPEKQEVFDMLTVGDTSTVFQFDTAVVRPFLQEIRPSSIHDLILITSIARPGGLDSKLEDGKTVASHFVKRRIGKEKISYLDPILEPILKDTYGLVIFQEQIQKIFEVVGGLTPIESDNARRAVGKKKLNVLISIKAKLFEGAQKLHGWSLEKCDVLWQSFIGAANYAFNRAHATAYGVIAYACAYLKFYYELEWWCSVLTNVEMEKVKQYFDEISHKLVMPHVTVPSDKWNIININGNNKLVAPLTLITGVGHAALEDIKSKHPFTSFEDFIARIDSRKTNKTVITNMIFAGAFESMKYWDANNSVLKVANGLEKVILSLESVDSNSPEDILYAYYLIKNGGKQSKAKNKSVPPEYISMNRIQMLSYKSDALQILPFNCVEIFNDLLQQISGYNYDESQKIYSLFGKPIIENFFEFDKWAKQYPNYEGDYIVVGLITDSYKWSYTDKRSKKKVKALKFKIKNLSKEIEIVVWPNSLEKINNKDFAKNGLIAVQGKLYYNSFYDEYTINYYSHRILLSGDFK